MVMDCRPKFQDHSAKQLGTVLKRAHLSRPACCGIFVLSILLATVLLIYTYKSEPIVWNKKTTTERAPWPTSESFWDKVAHAPRVANQCPYSSCPLTAADENVTQFADALNPSSTSSCPFYFRWIHEDLGPWMEKGISQKLLESSRRVASLRIVIKGGRLFIDPYETCFQTRAIFTIWGLLQLLKYYPGNVPDVDLLFGCWDRPVVSKTKYGRRVPPPVFRYCSTPEYFDIPFPDWSFWGWPEVNLRTWDGELCGILKGATEILWEERHPTAFWKGNPNTGYGLRKQLLTCNNKGTQIFRQDWKAETKAGFSNSKLSEQCKNRYKIYIEGSTWSVSMRYILACNSPALVVTPEYFDFYSRGLQVKKHFWPVRAGKLCDSLKFAVDWGNNHTTEAETMGRAGQQFITNKVTMNYVYDYMLHSLREYAKLLDFKPSSANMTEICMDTLLCTAPAGEKSLLEESMVRGPSDSPPCFLPPRDQGLIKKFEENQQNVTKQLEDYEDMFLGKD